jgi:hypothetical protein
VPVGRPAIAGLSGENLISACRHETVSDQSKQHGNSGRPATPQPPPAVSHTSAYDACSDVEHTAVDDSNPEQAHSLLPTRTYSASVTDDNTAQLSPLEEPCNAVHVRSLPAHITHEAPCFATHIWH